jgi:hypothetical protein
MKKDADAMTTVEVEGPNSALEQAHAQLVAAINAQAPGAEARYLSRLVLLLLNELKFSDSALKLIDAAQQERA